MTRTGMSWGPASGLRGVAGRKAKFALDASAIVTTIRAPIRRTKSKRKGTIWLAPSGEHPLHVPRPHEAPAPAAHLRPSSEGDGASLRPAWDSSGRRGLCETAKDDALPAHRDQRLGPGRRGAHVAHAETADCWQSIHASSGATGDRDRSPSQGNASLALPRGPVAASSGSAPWRGVGKVRAIAHTAEDHTL
jgi:hypothetical protein